MPTLDDSFQEMTQRCQHLIKHVPSALAMRGNEFRLRDQEQENRRLEVLVNHYRRERENASLIDSINNANKDMTNYSSNNNIKTALYYPPSDEGSVWAKGNQREWRESATYAGSESRNNYYPLSSSHLNTNFPVSENRNSTCQLIGQLNQSSRNILDTNAESTMRSYNEIESGRPVTRLGLVNLDVCGSVMSPKIIQSPTQVPIISPQSERSMKPIQISSSSRVLMPPDAMDEQANMLHLSGGTNHVNSRRYSPSKNQIHDNGISQPAVFRTRSVMSSPADFMSPPPENPCVLSYGTMDGITAVGQDAQFPHVSRSIPNQLHDTNTNRNNNNNNYIPSRPRNEIWESERYCGSLEINNQRRSASLFSIPNIIIDKLEPDVPTKDDSYTIPIRHLKSPPYPYSQDIRSFVKAEPLNHDKLITTGVNDNLSSDNYSVAKNSKGERQGYDEIVVGGVNRFLRYRSSDSTHPVHGEKGHVPRDHNNRRRRHHHRNTRENTDDKTCQTMDKDEKTNITTSCRDDNNTSPFTDVDQQVDITLEPNKSMYDEYYNSLDCYERTLCDLVEKEDKRSDASVLQSNEMSFRPQETTKAIITNERIETREIMTMTDVDMAGEKDISDTSKVSNTKHYNTSEKGINTNTNITNSQRSNNKPLENSHNIKGVLSPMPSMRSVETRCSDRVPTPQEGVITDHRRPSGPTMQQIEVASKLSRGAGLSWHSIGQRDTPSISPNSYHPLYQHAVRTKVIPRNEFKKILLGDWGKKEKPNAQQLSSRRVTKDPFSQRLEDTVLSESDFPTPPNIGITAGDKTKFHCCV